jgi:predicted transglutaminase-like protease
MIYYILMTHLFLSVYLYFNFIHASKLCSLTLIKNTLISCDYLSVAEFAVFLTWVLLPYECLGVSISV